MCKHIHTVLMANMTVNSNTILTYIGIFCYNLNMLKVFLVEDEIVMREGIKNKIDWESEDLVFAGEASDGELAFPMIKESAPDILITDIRMPFMDGLELSRLVKKEFPQIRIIILSGYDEFEYAKEAIEIGITEYLLKPITAAKLLEEVRKVAASIREERDRPDYKETYASEREEERRLERQDLFLELVNGGEDMSSLLKRGEALGVDLAAGAYSIFLFETRPYDTGSGVTEIYSESEVSLTDAIRNRFSGDKNVVICEQPGRVLAFLIMTRTFDDMKKKRRDIIRFLEETAGEYKDLLYFGATGEMVQRIREVSASYDDANRKFAHRFISDHSTIFYEHEIPTEASIAGKNPIDLAELDIGKLDRRIVTGFLRTGASREVDAFVDDFLNSLGEENVESLLFRQYVAMDLYFAIVSFLESLGIEKEKVGDISGNFRNASGSIVSVDSTRNYIRDLIAGAIEARNHLSERKYSRIIGEAREYIEANYNKEDITLNMVAASVNVSPNHFSAVFKSETGQTFIEFLTQVRMERARELLKTTAMKSSEIGYEVGYKDPHYFSYIFKKVNGCTPKEYRNEN